MTNFIRCFYYFRKTLREEDCLPLLLNQLGSPSLTIVSNSCGTLWNFSARNAEDQRLLWELGAVPMLQSLTNSKHKTISTCSLAALKNLYTANPAGQFLTDNLNWTDTPRSQGHIFVYLDQVYMQGHVANVLLTTNLLTHKLCL